MRENDYIVFSFVVIILLVVTASYLLFKIFFRCMYVKDDQVEEIQEDLLYIYDHDPDEECTICLENNTDVILSCHHKFHEECILIWFKNQATCPVCRQIM